MKAALTTTLILESKGITLSYPWEKFRKEKKGKAK